MAGKNDCVIWEFREHRQTVVHQGGVASWEVGAAASVEKERVS